jgi:hypothetical protein
MKMRKLRKMFYIVTYAPDAHYVFYTECTIKRFLGFRWISNNGMSFTAYADHKTALERLISERKGYIHARRVICQ